MSIDARRLDVDALRAIAVLCVITFHLHESWLPGGFVGVDVFFVISGFLITGGILERSAQGRFSLPDFYLRRFRRLFPAALATVACTLAAGAAWFSPEHLQSLAASSLSAVFSVSNLYFWRHQGYFDTSVEHSPLLHTWSLGVEEQFYLVWPWLVMACLGAGGGSRALGRSLLVVLAASVLAAEWLLESDAAAAYYLMPFRAGEFALGALCCAALRPAALDRFTRGPQARLLHVSGFAAIVCSASWLDRDSRFPGLHSLLPAAGAAAMLLGGQSGGLRAIGANAVLAWIGRLSYSLYLVHWPLLVFWRYHAAEPANGLTLALLGAAMMLAAVALHYGIEKPFRQSTIERDRMTPRVALTISLAGALAVCLTAAHAYRSHGWPGRVPSAIARAIENAREARALAVAATATTCSLDAQAQAPRWWRECLAERFGKRPGYLLIGDSHGRDTRETLRLAYPQASIQMLYQSFCLPFEYERAGRSACFVGMQDFLREELPRLPLRGVLLSSHFGTQQDSRIADTVAAIRAHDLPVVVFGPTMTFTQPVPDLALQLGRVAGLDRRVNDLQSTQLYERDAMLAQLARASGVGYVGKLDVICPGHRCLVVHEGAQALLSFDAAHWTPATHAYVATRWRRRWPELGDMFESSAGVAGSGAAR